jgi:membrane protease YdiL (CAAX protease family)
MIWKPFLPPEIVTRIGELGKLLPIPTRLLYGGITEEILLRWGFMTLLVWLPRRFLQKGQDKPRTAFIVGAIVVSSVVFALGHLPIAFLLIPEGSLALTTYVIIANSAFGLIAGYLYWKKGLESAIIAHMLTHVVLFAATLSGAYF